MLKFKKETEFKDTEIGMVPRDWERGKLREAIRSLESGNRPKGGKIKHDPKGILRVVSSIFCKFDPASQVPTSCFHFSRPF